MTFSFFLNYCLLLLIFDLPLFSPILCVWLHMLVSLLFGSIVFELSFFFSFLSFAFFLWSRILCLTNKQLSACSSVFYSNNISTCRTAHALLRSRSRAWSRVPNLTWLLFTCLSIDPQLAMATGYSIESSIASDRLTHSSSWMSKRQLHMRKR